ncbi:MAG: hypothetical protein WCR40_00815 [Candidatus Paceibacterota bacterium]|jgi:hypothetical protein|nr:hypothetical protein [Candidatus Paceibacterota bacterium]
MEKGVLSLLEGRVTCGGTQCKVFNIISETGALLDVVNLLVKNGWIHTIEHGWLCPTCRNTE